MSNSLLTHALQVKAKKTKKNIQIYFHWHITGNLPPNLSKNPCAVNRNDFQEPKFLELISKFGPWGTSCHPNRPVGLVHKSVHYLA